jgi:fumarate reductase subunit D
MTRSERAAGTVAAAVLESATTHAGVVTRVLAASVDLAVAVLAAVVMDLAAAGVRFAWAPAAFEWPQPGPLGSVTAVLVVAVVYLTVAWATTGRTYGERLLGLRTLTARHTLLGWTRSALRALACVVFPVGLLWCGVSRHRHSLQDLVFRTVVVYDSGPYLGGTRTRR